MPDVNELFQKRIVLSFNVTSNYCLSRGQYATKQGVTRDFDVYLPQKTPMQGSPAVILVHGEAPLQNLKDAGQYVSLGEWLASQGIAAITFNHATLLQGQPIEAILDDMRQLVRQVIASADQYQIDCNNLGLWAMSGGVPFALYLALKDFRSQFKSLALYYGFMTIRSLLDMFATFMPLDPKIGAAYEDFDTLLSTANGPTPAMFIARAGQDRPEINNTIDQSLPGLLRQNVRFTFYNHEQGQHAFDILDDVERSREILQATLNHFQYTLK